MINKIPIGIKSCNKNKYRQEAIRHTWLKNIDTNKFFPVFLIGRPGQPSELCGQLLYLDCEDHYQGLSGKIKAYYKWAISNTIAKHFFSCDDDSYINSNIFNSYNKYIEYDYSGSFIYGIDRYASGCGVFVSRDAAETCAVNMPDIARYDDVVVGDVLNRSLHNIKKLHMPNIHPWSYCQYIPNLIIGHYVHKRHGSLDSFESSMSKMHSMYHKT